jgi:hypothetical protein
MEGCLMDLSQVRAFVDYMVGWKEIGVAEDSAVSTPCSPEVRAFLLARLGDKTPSGGYSMSREQAHVLADFLIDMGASMKLVFPVKSA